MRNPASPFREPRLPEPLEPRPRAASVDHFVAPLELFHRICVPSLSISGPPGPPVLRRRRSTGGLPCPSARWGCRIHGRRGHPCWPEQRPRHACSSPPLAVARHTPRYGPEGRPGSTTQTRAGWTISRTCRGSRQLRHIAQHPGGCRGSTGSSVHGARRASCRSAGRTLAAKHPHGHCVGRPSKCSRGETPSASLLGPRRGPTGPPQPRGPPCAEGPRGGYGREVWPDAALP